ncbi:uncharacterized protein AB675_1026 [Cyphellophora attinorum]|uniref:DUF7908 domain-containing protein n=1 Tax=Cyphellophora attinorum TaxID=1664694 RepID=A0A0N0NKM1_9EURO|nr:uncharacterized protein AB675_1026 [Phialophora attinorum]KPI38188.1 hypothetical protein AB675_1026 [Phialophora attinorum]
MYSWTASGPLQRTVLLQHDHRPFRDGKSYIIRNAPTEVLIRTTLTHTICETVNGNAIRSTSGGTSVVDTTAGETLSSTPPTSTSQSSQRNNLQRSSSSQTPSESRSLLVDSTSFDPSSAQTSSIPSPISSQQVSNLVIGDGIPGGQVSDLPPGLLIALAVDRLAGSSRAAVLKRQSDDRDRAVDVVNLIPEALPGGLDQEDCDDASLLSLQNGVLVQGNRTVDKTQGDFDTVLGYSDDGQDNVARTNKTFTLTDGWLSWNTSDNGVATFYFCDGLVYAAFQGAALPCPRVRVGAFDRRACLRKLGIDAGPSDSTSLSMTTHGANQSVDGTLDVTSSTLYTYSYSTTPYTSPPGDRGAATLLADSSILLSSASTAAFDATSPQSSMNEVAPVSTSMSSSELQLSTVSETTTSAPVSTLSSSASSADLPTSTGLSLSTRSSSYTITIGSLSIPTPSLTARSSGLPSPSAPYTEPTTSRFITTSSSLDTDVNASSTIHNTTSVFSNQSMVSSTTLFDPIVPRTNSSSIQPYLSTNRTSLASAFITIIDQSDVSTEHEYKFELDCWHNFLFLQYSLVSLANYFQ